MILKKLFHWDLWKLNAKLLQDEIFTRRVQAAIERMTDGDKSVGHGPKWEIFKQNIKIMAMERASVIKNEEKKMEKAIRSKLLTLVKEECRSPGVFKDDILFLKEKLELLDRDRYRGALVRARADRLIAGELPTKRALGMEKGTPVVMRLRKSNMLGSSQATAPKSKGLFLIITAHYFLPILSI